MKYLVCFKPYKGVSSNIALLIFNGYEVGFKPYKGVSSNLYLSFYSPFMFSCFKPYKGVSSNTTKSFKTWRNRGVSNPIREYLQIKPTGGQEQYFDGFKPYKGVSSNLSA